MWLGFISGSDTPYKEKPMLSIQKLTPAGLPGQLAPRFGFANVYSQVDDAGNVMLTATTTPEDVARKYTFNAPPHSFGDRDTIVFRRAAGSDTIGFEINQRPVVISRHFASVLQALADLRRDNRESVIYTRQEKQQNREALTDLVFGLAKMAIAKVNT